MYTSACGDTVNCIEFILGIHTDIVVSYAHEVIDICGISMAFEGHLFAGTCMFVPWKMKAAVWYCFYF